MADESGSISRRTWHRDVEPIKKAGYKDGAVDGETATFQSSFNMGYEQGLSYGLEIGLISAAASFKKDVESQNLQLYDPRKINCQICLQTDAAMKNVYNSFNIQQEKNNEYLSKACNK